jgi:hypothetical protein
LRRNVEAASLDAELRDGRFDRVAP